MKTTEVGGEDRGYDGGKKIKGRKRHLLTDTLGLLVAVVVTAANIDDGTAAPTLLGEVSEEDFPRLRTIFGDNKFAVSIESVAAAGAPTTATGTVHRP